MNSSIVRNPHAHSNLTIHLLMTTIGLQEMHWKNDVIKRMSGRLDCGHFYALEGQSEDDGESSMVTIRRELQVTAPLTMKGSEMSKQWSISIGTNEVKEMFDIDLVHNDDPLFIASVENKNVGLAMNLNRTGATFFEICAKHWDIISRQELAKEWASDTTPPYDFEGNLRVDEDHKNICETPFQYPEEWQNETVIELRETNLIATSEIIEPVTVDPRKQRYRMKRLSERLSCRSGTPRRIYAHLLLFGHLLRRSQEKLDELCDEPIGFKEPKTSYADEICVLEDSDIFPLFEGDELASVVHAAQTKALSAVDEHVEHSFDYASQKITDVDMAKFSDEDAVFTPRSCSEDERQGTKGDDKARMGKVYARRYLQAFFAAHNKNIDNFCALLYNEQAATYSKYPKWEVTRYKARLDSDVRIRKALDFRLMIEEEAQEMRSSLYHQRLVDSYESVRSILHKRNFPKRGIRAGILSLQAEHDAYNVAHIVKINASILKRVVRFNERIGVSPSGHEEARKQQALSQKIEVP